MAGTLKNLDCHPIKIGGVEEHVHVFRSLSKNIAFSDLIGRLRVGRPREAVLGLPSRNCTRDAGLGVLSGRVALYHFPPGLKRLGYSVRPLCGRKKASKLQARAGPPAPQCGTGVLARQIAESGLEIVQTPDRR